MLTVQSVALSVFRPGEVWMWWGGCPRCCDGGWNEAGKRKWTGVLRGLKLQWHHSPSFHQSAEGQHMEEEGEISPELAAQRSQKELDDEIKKRKERQVGIDYQNALINSRSLLEVSRWHWSVCLHGRHHPHCCGCRHYQSYLVLSRGNMLLKCILHQ